MSEMKRNPGGNGSNQHSSHDGEKAKSEYAECKESSGISNRQAERWQQLSKIPDDEFEGDMIGVDRKL